LEDGYRYFQTAQLKRMSAMPNKYVKIRAEPFDAIEIDLNNLWWE